MMRKRNIKNILESLGSITRGFNVRGNYPFKQHALGRPHIDILFMLSEKSPLSIKEISKGLNVTSGAVTQFVDRLEGRGLLERAENPRDKRSRLVGLTEKSIQEINEFQSDYLENMGRIFSSLSSDELRQLERMLIKVRDRK